MGFVLLFKLHVRTKLAVHSCGLMFKTFKMPAKEYKKKKIHFISDEKGCG